MGGGCVGGVRGIGRGRRGVGGGEGGWVGEGGLGMGGGGEVVVWGGGGLGGRWLVELEVADVREVGRIGGR